MKKLCEKNKCTGCGGCVNICPQKAITLYEDNKGFLYPKIDEKKCINCGLCSKYTTNLEKYMNTTEHNKKAEKFYACKLKDDDDRYSSQSGGLFTALAHYVLKNNGVVYGCAYTESFKVKHIKIENLKDLNKLKGSKYVQSDIKDCYVSIENDLLSKKIVLFAGTPCQVAGIENYLNMKKINKELFYSCDLICHGVPSPKVYSDYLNFMEEKYNSKIVKVNLRDKSIGGWHNHIESLEFENGKKYFGKIYVDLFYSNLTLRDSCENCNYTSLNRSGDITMADCWGIEKKYPNLWNDNKGISLAMIQTSKGEKLFSEIEKEIDFKEINIEDCMQPQLIHATKVPYFKIQFWKEYNSKKFKYILKKYTPYGGLKFKIKRKIMKKIKKW